MNVDSIATLLNINKNEKGEYPFKIVDSKSDLGIYMIHYDVDTINETKVDDIARQLRGVIVSDNKGIIVPSFGYTPTIICDVYPEKDEVLKDKDSNEYSLSLFDVKDVFPMFDGTLLRVWKYNGNISIFKNISKTSVCIWWRRCESKSGSLLQICFGVVINSRRWKT